MKQQRIFFLGREIKTGGRSLETLGVGRFGICVLHVHNTDPHASSHHSDNEIEIVEDPVRSSDRPSRRNKKGPHNVVDLADNSNESDDEVCVVEVTDTSVARKRRRCA